MRAPGASTNTPRKTMCVSATDSTQRTHWRPSKFKESYKDVLDCVLKWGTSCMWVLGST